MYFQGSHYASLMLLFPLLEHSIRVLYVSVNNIPNRRVTAGINLFFLIFECNCLEADTLYTTLDILLHPDLGREHMLEKVESKELPKKFVAYCRFFGLAECLPAGICYTVHYRDRF
jgi:hypothetical protein